MPPLLLLSSLPKLVPVPKQPVLKQICEGHAPVSTGTTCPSIADFCLVLNKLQAQQLTKHTNP
jgi:hypothetical protein